MSSSIRKKDPKAPRFRRSVLKVLTYDFLRRFKEEYPQYKDLENEELKNILNTFHTNLYEGIIDNRDGVEFPESLGFCFIGCCKPPVKRKSLDIALSMEHNKRIRYRNFETDGHLAKIFYTNHPNKYRVSLGEMWTFVGNRFFTRRASEVFKKYWTRYVKIDPKRLITEMFTAYNKSKDKEWVPELNDSSYNEFKMD